MIAKDKNAIWSKKGNKKKSSLFEIILISIFWDDFLGCFNVVSNKLQSIDIDFYVVVWFYESFIQFISDFRNEKMFKTYEDRVSNLRGGG